MPVINPIDFFRDPTTREIPRFEGIKSVTMIDEDANPPLFTTQMLPDPSEGPGMRGDVMPFSGGAYMILLYWNWIAGGRVPCDGDTITIRESHVIGLQVELSQELQTQLQSTFNVPNIGELQSTITATFSLSVTFSREITREREFTITPPATGSKSLEFYQPIMEVRIIQAGGNTLSFANGLNHIREENVDTPEPRCDEEGSYLYEDGPDGEYCMTDGICPLEQLPGVDSEVAEIFATRRILTAAHILRLQPRQIAKMGIDTELIHKVRASAFEVMDKRIKADYGFKTVS